MEKSARNLENASELIMMLQHLCDSFSRGGASAQRIPWNGFSLTLAQVQELIEAVKDEMVQPEYSDGSAMAPRDTLPAGSLADRVQHVPTTRTRARELVGGGAGGPKSGAQRVIGDVAEH
ncbi:MAG: hypothetical protein KDD66_01310 [Bdellovibrionales bacterium]|nr:hypothetical protein [Bdellovibrionales bacterium]